MEGKKSSGRNGRGNKKEEKIQTTGKGEKGNGNGNGNGNEIRAQLFGCGGAACGPWSLGVGSVGVFTFIFSGSIESIHIIVSI